MRPALAVAFVSLAALAGVATQQRFPLKQDLEILKDGPMRAGLIVVDDKFPHQATDVLAQVKKVSRTSIFLGGVETRLLWLGRGHTNGDTVIYFPDLRTVHVGDLVIDGMPVIDYPGGGSAVEFLTTIDNLLKIDFDTMIPGHGKLMTKDDVRA